MERRGRREALEMHRLSSSALMFLLLVFFSLSEPVVTGVMIPARFDGFVYKNRAATTDSIMIEAFFDPVCPDSRDSWPPLKQALDHYGGHRVSLILHPFALPYHDNAFATSRALHIVDKVDSSATYSLLELFFEHQAEFYNPQTYNMSRTSVVDRIVQLASKAVGHSNSAIEQGFKDRQTDLATRISFKYGCSRGVYGTPFFFVNGFLLPDAGSPLDYNGWRKLLDPLISKQGMEIKEPPLHFFL